MDNPEATENSICETSQQLLPIENNCQPVEKVLLNNDYAETSNYVDQISNSENQIPADSTDVSSQNANVTAEPSAIVPPDSSMPPLPPLPKNDNGQLPQPPAAPLPADYNMQNYANYNNYMYNYNNYYGYPYPQYQWDYNSQQYYQPYQNYYNYNFNQANQTPTSKPPPPPPDSVQLPVEEKPANKTNTAVDDSNRYSPTAETDDDDPSKGLSENYKPDVLIEKPTQTTNDAPFEIVTSELIEVQKNIPENIDSIIQQTIDPPTLPLITPVQQQRVPVMAPVQSYNIQVQQHSYQINPQSQIQSTETVNEVVNQQQTSPAMNGKDDSIEKVSKASTVLGKSQAKKRLMAFSMMKQKLQEQNNSVVDNQSSDIGEGNDGEFVPEHNVFQTVTKKKVVTNKKVAKVIKAQQTIEQIEEMKKDELLQGNNAALYQHLLRSGGNEAPILQKLGIESLAEKYSAKIREQDKRSSRHHHRRRDESRRGHKYRRRSHSKSRSRSRSTEKPKMRALEVKSWKDFVKGGFHFDRFRRFKMDEAEEIKDKERKSRKKKRHGDSRSEGKNHKNESNILSETEKGTGDQKLRHNLLDRKKEILKGLEVNTHEGDFTKDFPSYIIRCTKSKPAIKFSENPANATYHLQNRQQMLATLLPEIEAIVLKFLSAMKPKKLKENCCTDKKYNSIDEKLLVMMKDKNIYPFKGWWPKTNFIITQVEEDPNVEIDEDVLMNEITTSKRTKKSRFNDDTSLVELRPTVPSKWDSDYDGSPAAENKVAYVGEVTQSVDINTNDNVCTIKREENNPLDISHQEEAMDTASDVGEDEPKIEVNVCSALPVQIQEPQGHTKLNTEYEEFLKIVKVDKEECDISITTSATNITTQKDNENNLSMKSASLNDDSIQDESEEYMSTKSSVESVSLQNVAEESDSNDGSFVEELSAVDLKYRKKKKSSSKKSKTLKNKESKKKRYKSSSSESSQDSESESDSSSDDSDSESTDSTSTVEKKKKSKSKNKKKRKTKTNYKKKHRGDKNKTKSTEDEKDANSSILNLIEKALNVEIKKRPSDSKEPRQKKKKRKHEKKENKSNEENDDKFEKVKDCLKETITKLVKTEKVNKNQSLSCDDTVIEVLKYLNDKEKKNKKSKKSLKRKHDSDISDDEETPKKSKLVDSCSKSKVNDKKKKSKKKKSVDSDEYVTKKKSKKKSKTTDTSEAEEDEEVVNQNKSKNDSVQFFELRPNEWNTIKKSSRRGVVHHSEVKNKNKTSPLHNTRKCNENVRQKQSKPLNSIDKRSPTNRSKNKCEIPKLLDVFKEQIVEKERQKQLLKPNKNIKSDKIDNYSKNTVEEEKNLINFKNSDSEPNEEIEKCFEEIDEMSNKHADKCPNDIFKLKNDLQQTIFLKNDNSELHNRDKDSKSNFKPQTQSTPPIDLYDNPPITCTIMKAATETISYRDKVKMNLKKLSSCQNIPFVFGFSSPISLIKSNNFKFDENKDFKVIKEEEEKSNEDESKVDDPKINETQLLESDKPKVINFAQTQIKIPDVTKKQLLKTNIETNDKKLDHSYDWDDSEESDTGQSIVTSTNSSEHSSEQINSNLLKNDSPIIPNKNETFSNNSESKELEKLPSNVFETNSSFGSVIKEQDLPLEVDSLLIEKEITTLSNFTDFSKQNLDCNDTEGLENDVNSVKMDKKDSDSVHSQKSSNDIIEVSKSNNELITQWTSDWINLDKSVTEINHSSNSKSGDKKLQLKKKSRWDKQSMDNKISKSQILNNVQEEYKDETETKNLTDEVKYTNSPTANEDDLFNEQNQTSEIMSINCLDDYHEIKPLVYDDYSQTYEQYSSIPTYSEMKSIEHDLLNPIDYSVYENFNPNYNYQNEDYEMWKSVDTDTSEHGMIKAIPTIDETVSQLVNVSVDQVEFSQEEVPNENIDTIISDTQEEIVKNEKSDSASSDELFVKLYHQHFQHYNQNPIKYSLSDPVIIKTDDAKINIPDVLTPQENLSETDQISDDTMSIPLKTRAYVCILEDDNTNLYLTSDNYMAYCAVEDKCMVHISVNACSRDGVGNDVRHCFNVSLNGSINEYWLHADLIPFHVPSDAESGVFSDDEADSLDSDSGHDEDVDNDNNENDDHIIESEWEIVDNIHDNVNSWLDEPHILKKYNIEHDVSHINQDHYVTSSSECDTDGSEFSDSYVEEMFNDKQNINENHFQKSFETKDDKPKYQNVIDLAMPINVSENTENSDLLVETEKCINSSEQIVLDVEMKNEIDTLEVVNEHNLTSKINLENNDVLGDLVEKVNNDNVSVMSEEKENNNGNKSGVCLKEEVTVADLSMMDTIINQKILIQKLKVRAKEKIREKLPDTIMISYSDNMETIKHPFLGLFQPPTNSILSKSRSTKPTRSSNLSKRVTFADGIRPGDNLAASPTHDDVGRPLSPPPLKRLMRETLKFKRNMYPFKKTKVRTKLTMVKKKVAKVTPSIKETNPSVIEYYISRRRFEDLPTEEIPNSSFLSFDHSSNNDNEETEKMSTPPRPTREVTPVPSDTECWNDDDTIKNNR